MPPTPASAKWEDPPSQPGDPRFKRSGRRSPWEPLANQLRKSPGAWLKVTLQGGQTPQSYTDLVSRIRRGKPSCFAPAGSFEAFLEHATTEQVYVYLRYVGQTHE